MDALGIADGAVVADIGAGGGWFTVRLAQRVGPNGLVYAEDIQPADDRVDQPARPARGADQRAVGHRDAQRTRCCRARSTPC